MTFEEIRRLDCDFLTVQQVASCLRMDPQTIRDQAEREPRYLGFPICRAGRAFKVPRLGFVAWMCGQIPILEVVSSNQLFRGFERMGLTERSDAN